MKIPVTICNVPSVKMSWADFQGILEIASLPEGPLKHKNVLISGISKHALMHAIAIWNFTRFVLVPLVQAPRLVARACRGV